MRWFRAASLVLSPHSRRPGLSSTYPHRWDLTTCQCGFLGLQLAVPAVFAYGRFKPHATAKIDLDGTMHGNSDCDSQESVADYRLNKSATGCNGFVREQF